MSTPLRLSAPSAKVKATTKPSSSRRRPMENTLSVDVPGFYPCPLGGWGIGGSLFPQVFVVRYSAMFPVSRSADGMAVVALILHQYLAQCCHCHRFASNPGIAFAR